MALIQYSFRSEVLKENTEIYVILPTYEVFRDPEKKGAETYYKEYERKKRSMCCMEAVMMQVFICAVPDWKNMR